MKNGDISNKQAPYVGFDIDTLLYVEPKDTLFRKVKEVFRPSFTNYKDREINIDFKRIMHWLWNNHNVSIVLLTMDINDDSELQDLGKLLDDKYWIPYTKLNSYQEWEDIRTLLSSGMMESFFSTNMELISYCSHPNAKHFKDLREVYP